MKKLGFWLPSRKTYITVDERQPGYFISSFRDGLVKRLRKLKGVKLYENLDFRNALIKNGEVYVKDLCLNDLDLFYWFGEIDRSEASYPVEVLETLSANVKIINDPKGLKTGLDKFKTQQALKSYGIRAPDFILASKENIEDALPALKEKEYILKPRKGSFGKGMVRFREAQGLVDVVDYSAGKSHFLEEFIPNEFEEWIGVNVIGGKIVYGYGKKKEKIAGWKVFDRKQKGGKMLLKWPNNKQEKIAIGCGKATNLTIYGVDIIKSTKNGKYYVIDVNTYPGLYPEMFKEAKVDGVTEIIRTLRENL